MTDRLRASEKETSSIPTLAFCSNSPGVILTRKLANGFTFGFFSLFGVFAAVLLSNGPDIELSCLIYGLKTRSCKIKNKQENKDFF